MDTPPWVRIPFFPREGEDGRGERGEKERGRLPREPRLDCGLIGKATGFDPADWRFESSQSKPGVTGIPRVGMNFPIADTRQLIGTAEAIPRSALGSGNVRRVKEGDPREGEKIGR